MKSSQGSRSLNFTGMLTHSKFQLLFFVLTFFRLIKELNALPDVQVAGARSSDLYSQEERKQVLSVFGSRKKLKKEKEIIKLSSLKESIELKIKQKKEVSIIFA